MQELLNEIRTVARGMWRFRWHGLAAALATAAIGALVVLLIPSQYEAAAKVYVDSQSILKPLLRDLTVQPNVEQQIAMMSRTLISRPNVERVLRSTDLDVRVTDADERENVVDDMLKRIRFTQAPGASTLNLFTLAYRHPDPDVARNVVQALLGIFVESSLGDKRRDGEQARRFIEEQIRNYEQRLLDSEAALKDFKIKNLGLMPNLAGDYLARIAEAQNQLTQARLELRQTEQAREALRRQFDGAQRDGSGGIDTQEQLDGLRQRLTELLIRFTEEHPDVVATRQQIAQLQSRRGPAAEASAGRAAGPLATQLRLGMADAEAQIAALRTRVTEFEGRLEELRQAARTVPEVEAQYTQLTRDYEINKKNYEQLIARRESAQLSGHMDAASGIAEFRVVEPPRVSPRPVAPNRAVLLAVVLLLALGVGSGVAFLLDQSHTAFFDARALRRQTGLPLLGGVSFVRDERLRARARLDAWLFSGSTAALVLTFAVAIAVFAARQLTR